MDIWYMDHVDTVAVCNSIDNQNGSIIFSFEYSSPTEGCIIVEKGSVCLNGISLTVFNVSDNQFSVAVIPYTLSHTNLKYVNKGDEVNIEFDILGRLYLQKYYIRILYESEMSNS